MTKKDLLELISLLSEQPEYIRKKIAILLLSTTLNAAEIKKIADLMRNIEKL